MVAELIEDLEALEPIVARPPICRIGFCCDGEPYVVPMNFGYRDGVVYLHTSPSGRKMEMLERNHNVCFEVDIDHAVKQAESACQWGMRFRSVIGQGEATLIEDEAGKRDALDVIMDHYSHAAPRVLATDAGRGRRDKDRTARSLGQSARLLVQLQLV